LEDGELPVKLLTKSLETPPTRSSLMLLVVELLTLFKASIKLAWLRPAVFSEPGLGRDLIFD
jgi:hypothetical protein